MKDERRTQEQACSKKEAQFSQWTREFSAVVDAQGFDGLSFLFLPMLLAVVGLRTAKLLGQAVRVGALIGAAGAVVTSATSRGGWFGFQLSRAPLEAAAVASAIAGSTFFFL